MWPFDKLLTNRIKDLERIVEVLTGANSVLTTELAETKQREAILLNKIFDFAGLNSSIPNKVEHNNKPISVGKQKVNWPQLKENLELKAREEYWSNKNKEAEQSLDELEKEILGD